MSSKAGHILYEIPIKPHLNAFISNFSDTMPYVANKTDLFGRVIVKSLQYPLMYNELADSYDFPILKVSIPLVMLERNGNYDLTRKSIKSINKYLNDLFYFTFLEYVRLRQSLIKEVKTKSIDAFVDYYGLNYEVINRETLEKYVRRNF